MKILSLFALTIAVFCSEGLNLEDISRALRNGDVDTLAKYFDDQLELAIVNEEDIYSKDVAKEKVRQFFARNKPSSFNQIHKGQSKGNASHYCIGNLKTTSSTYRVYIYMKKERDRYWIKELRFDKE